MIDLEQFRHKTQEISEVIKNKIKMPTFSVGGRWNLASLVLASGMLVSACSVRGNETQYSLENISSHLEDKKLEQSGNAIKRVSFWLGVNFPEGSSNKDLGIDVCFQGKGTAQLMSYRVHKQGSPPPVINAETIEFNNNCITASLDPVANFADQDDYAFHIGIDGMRALRIYSLRRDSQYTDQSTGGLSAIYIGSSDFSGSFRTSRANN